MAQNTMTVSLADGVVPDAEFRCKALTISDYGAPLSLETRWAKRHDGSDPERPNGIVTGLISPRGIMRWAHGDTRCLTCNQPVSDHLPRD